jgi:hypothetical protein
MTRHRTYRVIAYKTQTMFIDVAARDVATAITRAQKQWDSGMHNRFHELLDYQPMRFELDEEATCQLGDVTNEDRARWAKVALQAFDRETGSGLGEEGLHDLLCDLGHYADTVGIDFTEALDRAGRIWAEETIDALQETHSRPAADAERAAEGGAQ